MKCAKSDRGSILLLRLSTRTKQKFVCKRSLHIRVHHGLLIHFEWIWRQVRRLNNSCLVSSAYFMCAIHIYRKKCYGKYSLCRLSLLQFCDNKGALGIKTTKALSLSSLCTLPLHATRVFSRFSRILVAKSVPYQSIVMCACLQCRNGSWKIG